MKKIILIAIFATLLPIQANASWVIWGGNDQKEVYFENTRVVKNLKSIDFWIKVVWLKPWASIEGKMLISSMQKYRIDCKNEQIALLATNEFADAEATKYIGEQKFPNPEFKHIAPGSDDEFYMKKICNR
ncbi:surface-adhesin E family protein [Polynucleobacter sp. AP-Sving-400A-A2]|uniref:surface-adhesin E family protein n=1 Tax=Polynucleobacter sp. AP-Sving-400A-A2 TaxID=2081049 RepID=UPI001BFE737B|nr:surface-adhesin E family protein [Polynucleobacter sp. AP-Sving-400A-A2]QWE13966.1 hypothetical protein C2758_07235 [Polynucleobacter sp. AP-Sving-400A-A2]